MSSFKSSCASRLFGKFASKKFPAFFQNIINSSYVKLMKLDMSEFNDSSSYKSLNDLFTRELKVKREFSKDEKIIISPCDAYISESGKIEDQKALQIKGHSYRVREVLGSYVSKKEKDKLQEGTFLNFYLSPKDYHRYHVPCDMRVTKAIHIPGKLYPVNFTWLKKVPELFVENERVVLECYTSENKLFYMVFVGALNVGKMKFFFDEKIETNISSISQSLYLYDNLYLKKGEELGCFKMGSTIVMFFEKEMCELICQKNESIRFGEDICKL